MESRSINFKVKIGKETISFWSKGNITVSDIKLEIFKITGIPTENQILLKKCGKSLFGLTDERTFVIDVCEKDHSKADLECLVTPIVGIPTLKGKYQRWLDDSTKEHKKLCNVCRKYKRDHLDWVSDVHGLAAKPDRTSYNNHLASIREMYFYELFEPISTLPNVYVCIPNEDGNLKKLNAKDVLDVSDLCTLEGMKERTLLLGGFSKSFAMTGWRIAYICGPAEWLKALLKIHQYSMLCAPTISQIAAETALKDCLADRDAMRASYKKRRDFMVKGLNKAGLDCHSPGGAFYVFPSIKKTGLSSMQFAKSLLAEKNVAVVPGSAFGPEGEGFIRMSYATSEEELKTALQKITEFVNEHT